MKARVYKGRIYHKDVDWLNNKGIEVHWLHTYYFIQTGEWIANSKPIGSYQICMHNGEVIEKYEDCQFSRSRDNTFYLETYK